MVENPPPVQETPARSPGTEDPLEKEMGPTPDSCLENPVGRGAWQAAVHGVTKDSHMT